MMKKLLYVILLLLVPSALMIACSKETNELQDNAFSVFTPNPTVDYSETAPGSSSGYFVVEFNDNNKAKIIHNGEEYPAEYELKDNKLSITFKDDNKENAEFVVTDLKKHEDNENIYIGLISKVDIEENHPLRQVFYSLPEKEAVGFLKDNK